MPSLHLLVLLLKHFSIVLEKVGVVKIAEGRLNFYFSFSFYFYFYFYFQSIFYF